VSSGGLRKKLKSSLNFLNTAYYRGVIGYPRVDNDFIAENKSFDMFPHPSIPPINKTFKPFKKKKKTSAKKEEFALVLSAIRIITPQHIERVFDYLDGYLTDDLMPRSEKIKDEIIAVINALESFTKSIGMTDKELIALKHSFYEECKANGSDSFVFTQPSISFFSSSSEARAKCHYIVKEKTRSKGSKYGNVKTAPDIQSALNYFDKIENFDNSPKEDIILQTENEISQKGKL